MHFEPQDLLIAGMMRKLPPVGGEWPLSDRLTWFRAMAAIMDLIWGDARKRVTTISLAAP